MKDYIKAGLQTILVVTSFVFLITLGIQYPEMTKEIVAWIVIGFLCLLFLSWIFLGFLERSQRKSGTYKEPDVNNHYG